MNTTPASRAAWDTPGLSLSSPGWGEWNRARMGRSGVHSARCWAQTSAGHSRRGPPASRPTLLPCPRRVGHRSSPPGSWELSCSGQGRWAPERETELEAGLRAAVQGPLPLLRRRTSYKTLRNARTAPACTHSGQVAQSVSENRPQAEFPGGLASRVDVGVRSSRPPAGHSQKCLHPPALYFLASCRPCNGPCGRREQKRCELQA